MTFMFALAGILSAFVGIYLVYVLFNPEKF
ncbi:MAG: K(+)-transporting ATPase subunit F [Methylotenera sp.]|nr:K(+)-transporting ATPase subunit F [Oligoflexia bacterium]